MTPPLRLRSTIRYRVTALPLSFVRDRDTSARTRATPLLDAVRPSILRALTADRAGAYVTILAELLALRRTGTLAATLDDLRRRLSGAPLDEPAFLRDLLQLEEWGCLTRELEPRSLRGYRDARRERFRHRLTDDAVALLEFLEGRLARGHAPLRVDADDRLRDVFDRARELLRLADAEASPPDEVDARRALHLARAIDAELDAIAGSLVSLHAEMRRFAARTFEPRALERVVSGLEAYVAGFLRNVGERRRAIGDVVARLAAPDLGGRLARLVQSAVAGDAPFSTGENASSASSTARWSAFLEDGGELDDHCAQIEAATHEVIAKLRDRMTALERRGDRGYERACAIRALAAIDEASDGTLPVWGFGTPTWAPGDGARLVPPLPRRATRAHVEEPRALPIKRGAREVVRESRQARVLRIADWLRHAVVAEGSAQLSKTRHDALRSPDAVATWMSVARAQHFARGAGLAELGVRIEPTGGVATVGNDTIGLASPDCIVTGLEGEHGRRA